MGNGEVAEEGVESRGLKMSFFPHEWRSSLFVGDGHDQVQEQFDVLRESRENAHEGEGGIGPR